MKKLLVSLLFVFGLPGLALASIPQPLDFTPDMNDISVVFLSNIFGTVEGVGLYSSGSQIMGEMFRVFNAAVLALGCMILMYIVLVATLTTANDGQFLGRKWQSLWVPVRCVCGIALLVPQSSGYCIVQIMVMWVVLQGVGAANKIWGAALDYLQGGGSIVVSNIEHDPADENAVAYLDLSAKMLESQVCMNAIEDAMKRTYEMNRASRACIDSSTEYWCKATPSFLGSVNFERAHRAASAGGITTRNPVVQFPDFPRSNPYSTLNGVCGKVTWESFSEEERERIQEGLGSHVDDAILERTILARTAALQSMYNNLRPIAQRIVKNQMHVNEHYSVLPLGEPLDSSTTQYSVWGSPGSLPALLGGNELHGAASAYHGIMRSTMTAMHQKAVVSDSRLFIHQAKQDGWVMAGSYYYDLARLNELASDVLDNASSVTADTGDSRSLSNSAPINHILNRGIMPRNVSLIDALIQGGQSGGTVIDEKNSVDGYAKNAKLLTIRNVSGVEPPSFSVGHFTVDMHMAKLDPIDFPRSGFMNIPGGVGGFLYNNVMRNVINVFIMAANALVMPVINGVFQDIVQNINKTFKKAFAEGTNRSNNPVMVLAVTGNELINDSVDLMFTSAFALSSLGANFPIAGVIMALIMFMLPMVMSMLSMMFGIGVLLAFYIPIMPYLLFTLGAVAWLIGVIEAMVAAPVVALGVMHPDGQHDVFGKGDKAIMLLLNVFLRPGMMVIGFVVGIILSYVAIWMLNTGFDYTFKGSYSHINSVAGALGSMMVFFIYVSTCVAIIQKAFSLIYHLPDKILRWLSDGIEESLGSGAEGMAQQVQGDLKEKGQKVEGGTSGALQNANTKNNVAQTGNATAATAKGGLQVGKSTASGLGKAGSAIKGMFGK